MEASLTQLQQDITDYIASAQQHITNLEATVRQLQASGTGDQALISQLDQQVQAAKAAISNPPAPAAAPPAGSATDPAAGATGGASDPSSGPGSVAGSADPSAGAAGTGTPAATSGGAASATSDAPASGGGAVTGDPGTAAPAADSAAAPARTVYLFTGTDVTSIDHNMWPDSGQRTPDGRTLYFFSGDVNPGDANGDGVGGGMWQRYTGPTVPAA